MFNKDIRNIIDRTFTEHIKLYNLNEKFPPIIIDFPCGYYIKPRLCCCQHSHKKIYLIGIRKDGCYRLCPDCTRYFCQYMYKKYPMVRLAYIRTLTLTIGFDLVDKNEPCVCLSCTNALNIGIVWRDGSLYEVCSTCYAKIKASSEFLYTYYWLIKQMCTLHSYPELAIHFIDTLLNEYQQQ